MITLVVNIIGLIIGVHWFGWWFLVPAILAGASIKVNGSKI